MAVSKMSKVTFLTQDEHCEQLLATIQGFHEIEIRELFRERVSNQWLDDYFEDRTAFDATKEIADYDEQLDAIKRAIEFVEHYGDKQKKSKHLKRYEAELYQLESAHDQAFLERELTEIQQLKKAYERNKEKQLKLQEDEQFLREWQALDVLPVSLGEIDTLLYTAEAEVWEKIKNLLDGFYYELIYQGEKCVHFAIITSKNQKEELVNSLQKVNARLISYNYEELPEKELIRVRKQQKENIVEHKRLVEQIGEKKKWIEAFEKAEEVLLAKRRRALAREHVIEEDSLVLIQGWVSTDDQTALERLLQEKNLQTQVYLSIEEPTDVEINEDIPTKLTNHPLVQPFELLTEMYSLPKYHEIDPTPWFMPFYFVFFGMMVADVGYGALLLVASSIALTRALPRGTTRFLRFFQILSVPTILWGLLYNSFFGFSLNYPTPLSTSDDVITLLLLSIAFGFIQLLVGLGLSAAENIKAKQYVNAVSEGFAWQGILLGLVIAGVGRLLLNETSLFIAGVVLAGISMLSVVVLPLIQTKNKGKGLLKGLYQLYGITGYIGDLVSYTRLMALGISGGSIAAAFNLLVGYMPPAARFSVGILLMIALHGLNLFLSLLSAYVHGARLQYVEFFGKFYTGGGRAFDPLRPEEKHLKIRK